MQAGIGYTAIILALVLSVSSTQKLIDVDLRLPQNRSQRSLGQVTR